MNINGWDEWQSYRKDRGTPPWIKVYRNLMSNEEWVSLTDAEKGQLVSLWILGADKNGTIPDNPATLQRMCMLQSKPNLSKFIDLGFLTTTCQPSGNQVVTMIDILDAPEKRREETEKSRKTFIPPSLEEIKEYALSRSSGVDPKSFYEFFDVSDWVDSKGNKVKNWKQKFISWDNRTGKKENNPHDYGRGGV